MGVQPDGARRLMPPRKKWSTTVGGNPVTRRTHESKVATYEHVRRHRGLVAAGVLRGSYTSVWVDERDGHGWKLYERIEHGTEAK